MSQHYLMNREDLALNMTFEELQAVEEAMTEADIELAGGGDYGNVIDLGDGYTIVGDDPDLGELADYIAEQTEFNMLAEHVRAGEDAADAKRAAGPRRQRHSAAEKIARSYDRIAAGTYLSRVRDPQLRDALTGMFTPEPAEVDPVTGRSAERWPELGSEHSIAVSEVTSSAEAVDGYLAALRRKAAGGAVLGPGGTLFATGGLKDRRPGPVVFGTSDQPFAGSRDVGRPTTEADIAGRLAAAQPTMARE